MGYSFIQKQYIHVTMELISGTKKQITKEMLMKTVHFQ